MQIRKAERRQARIRMALQGPAGSGKTYSALLAAFGLTNSWDKVVVIDTENLSADLYAHLGQFNVVPLNPPFSPEKYIEAINFCSGSGMEVIILDSISHEWDVEGGVLDIHGNMAGNSFTNWAKITPRHNRFVQEILHCPANVIATIRSKQDYVLNEKNGKNVPEKVGLKGVTRDGMDYEFTLVFDLDIKHHALASKDRTGIFMDKPEMTITTETGRIIKDWCNAGVSNQDVIEKIRASKSLGELNWVYNQHPEQRTNLLPEFKKQKELLQGPSSIISNTKPGDNGTDQNKQ